MLFWGGNQGVQIGPIGASYKTMQNDANVDANACECGVQLAPGWWVTHSLEAREGENVARHQPYLAKER